MTYFLGLDLGGTNIKAGVIDDQGHVHARHCIPTEADRGPDQVITNMIAAAQGATEQAGLSMNDIARVGIGSPGPLDLKKGLVLAAPNMKGWDHVPLRDRIAQETNRPTVLENDANAAAFGEFWVGAGRDPKIRHLVMLTLGTGVGSGIIINGHLLHGAFGNGAESGHMIVVPDGRLCGCGQRGCLETYASASHTAVRTHEELAAGKPSSLQETFAKDPKTVNAKAVFEAAHQGDELAMQIVDRTAYYLAIACINFTRIIEPQMIVFAGGMALAGDHLLNMVRRHFQDLNWHCAPDQSTLAIAELGNDAGIIGAASVAWDAHCAATSA